MKILELNKTYTNFRGYGLFHVLAIAENFITCVYIDDKYDQHHLTAVPPEFFTDDYEVYDAYDHIIPELTPKYGISHEFNRIELE